MKKLLLSIVLLIASLPFAQSQDVRPTFEDYQKVRRQSFNQYQQQKEDDFDAFRREANAVFADKMDEAWQFFKLALSLEVPSLPDPDTPLIRDKEPLVSPMPFIPGNTLSPIPPSPEKKMPLKPNLPQSNDEWLTFNFFNTPCKVHFDNSLRFSLPNVMEQNIAAAWKQLSGEASDVLVADCFQLINTMNLCDWATICFFKALGEACFGKGSNEAVLIQMYLLTQTGYKVRIGRIGNELVLLAPFDGVVYGKSYYECEDEAYYNITGEKSESGCYTYPEAFPNERRFSLKPFLPILVENMSESRTFKAKNYPEISIPVSVNRNLMDFLDTYPQCRWDNYIYAGFSKETKEKVYPILQKAIEGKPVEVAANMLLNFMHTAFDYKSDTHQFGYERSFFGDELFWFPYNDCEDRSIMYCILVRDLLGLDALLLEYPGHISTAISLPMEVRGSYIEVKGKHYLMCDPTFIGSQIGEVPKKFRKVNPNVIILKK